MVKARFPSRRPGQREMVSGMLWLAACLTGGYLAMGYEFQAGRLGPIQARWPAESAMARSREAPTILAFLHPRCHCTAATVTQLVRVVAAHPGAALLVPVFVPQGLDDPHEWTEGAYVQAIRAAVPTAKMVPDWGGTEARRFGALTSGTILVYDPEGTEIFRGGITNRRGGEDDNPGLQRFAQVLDGRTRSAYGGVSPVFGCPLVLADRDVNP